jgi:hypothetical protein
LYFVTPAIGIPQSHENSGIMAVAAHTATEGGTFKFLSLVTPVPLKCRGLSLVWSSFSLTSGGAVGDIEQSRCWGIFDKRNEDWPGEPL